MDHEGNEHDITATKSGFVTVFDANHKNIDYLDELADQLAKEGLVEGDGIPKVKKLEDMQEYIEG